MKLVVAGGRDRILNKLGVEALNAIRTGFKITEIVSGCADGVDAQARIFAQINELPYKGFQADWSLGPRAGPMRNLEMAKYADACVVFEGGRGTDNMYMHAVTQSLFVFDFRHKADLTEKMWDDGKQEKI